MPIRRGFDSPIALSPGWCSLSMLFSDWDRSGRRDLRVSNDRHYYTTTGDGQEQLWRIDRGEPPHLYTESEGWQTVKVWGMGIASYDLTDDGYPEYFLTSQADNKLQTLADGPAEPNFEDMALETGVTATRPYVGDTELPSTAWHAEFQDVNNDSFVDLFVGKGNVEAMPEYAAEDPSNLLIGQADGTFVEGAEAAGIVSYDRARGASLADFNLDGMVDLVVVNRREPVRVWRNAGLPDGSGAVEATPVHWLAVQLQGAGSNTSAIGSWIEVQMGDRIIQREVTVGGGHAGGQLGWTHFGLGTATEVEIRVQWPDGETGPWLPVNAAPVPRHRAPRGRPADLDPGGRLIAWRQSARRPASHPLTCPNSAAPMRRRRFLPRRIKHAWRASGSGRPRGGTTGWWCTPTASTARTWLT